MFESMILHNKESAEDKRAREGEERQMDFAREQTINAAAVDPNDDVNYMVGQNQKSDLIRWQQELEPEMYQMVLSLQSLRDSENGPVPILDQDKKPIPPICNRTYIYQVVVPILRPFISKNLINSHLDDSEIRRMQETTANDMCDMMADNWDKYAIDFTNYDGIIRNIKNVIKASVWRAYKGWTKKTDNAMTKRIESEQYGNRSIQEDKKGHSLFNKGS